MKLKIFCIYDDKAKAYLSPFFLPEVAMAFRTFTDCVRDPSHAFFRHPADYTLFYAGEFDQNSGAFSPESVLSPVCNGVECKE